MQACERKFGLRMSTVGAVPLRIGQYRVSKTLGIGSFGKVKLGHHEVSGQRVAIKILNKKRIKEMDMGEKVRREIKNLRRLDHPHIIRLYEVIHTPTDIFVVMEYVAGGELFEYIVERGRLPEAEARRFFQQIIAAVEYCHYKGVIHRDLKPENLLRDSTSNVKIADFGLSNTMEDAPEVISGHLYVGPEVDVWSCGVILYAVLCGSLPFDDDSIPVLFKKIKGGMYQLPPFLSAETRDLIPRLLIVDPVKRITIPEIRQHPWFKTYIPRYLELPPEVNTALDQVEHPVALDEAVIDAVAKLQIHGVCTATEVTAHVHRARKAQRANDVSVVYHLLMDDKLHRQRNAEIEAARRPDATVRRLTAHDTRHVATYGYHVLGPGGERIGSTGGRFAPTGQHLQLPTSQASAGVRRRRWYLGIQSRKEPGYVMLEVYRALQSGSFTWQTITPYQLTCRWEPSVEMEGSFTEADRDVRLGLNLYKVCRGIYLLDIEKLRGDPFSFMNMCARVITELKVPAYPEVDEKQRASSTADEKKPSR